MVEDHPTLAEGLAIQADATTARLEHKAGFAPLFQLVSRQYPLRDS